MVQNKEIVYRCFESQLDKLIAQYFFPFFFEFCLLENVNWI